MLKKFKKSLSLLLAVIMLLGIVQTNLYKINVSAAGISLNRPLDQAYTITAREYYSSGSYHGAIDYGCPKGTPVYAAESGQITINDGGYGDGYSGSTAGNGWGNYADITHSNGYKTRYAHMSTGRFVVKSGSDVSRGQLIGYSGNSGNSTGPHLHFGLYLNNNKVYPESYITSATDYHIGPSVNHVRNTSYATNFTAYPKRKIVGSEIFDGNHNMYSSTAWIGTSDLCTIHEVYTDGCCKVTYPLDDGGSRTRYSKIEYFNTKPTNVKLTPDTTATLHIGQTITLKSSASNVTSYKITVQLNGKTVVSENSGQYYYFKCTNTGTYSAYTTATNSCGSADSSKISFKVVGHSFDKVISSTAATCTSTGKTVYACSGILAYYSEKCNATKTETIAKNPNNHTGGTTVKNKTTATCTSEGYTGDTYCNGCNAKISSGSTIAKKSHTYNSGVITKNSTCSTTGVKTYTCTVCNSTKTETIAKASHSYKTTTTAATCTKDGLSITQCTVCGDVSRKETIKATGHKDNNFDGICDNCGYSKDTAPSNPTQNCSCNCHKNNFIWLIQSFFWKIFARSKHAVCGCGIRHW